jgi:hypothetical protein
MATTYPSAPIAARRDWRTQALRLSAILLVAVSWISAAIFGAYILAFYGGAAFGGVLDRWNQTLPHLHETATRVATLAIGLHFLTGGTLLLLGPVQLIAPIRARWPRFHRWTGRLYVLAAALAGIGGLGFIFAKGTVGGTPMDLGFGLYGALMLAFAVLAYTTARARRFDAHRGWAIRLFALAIGSWLYRMEYGFWFLVAGTEGHTADFRGWFDLVMMTFFYLPNLAVAELFLRARRNATPAIQTVTALAMLAVTAFLVLATWVFANNFWVPGMIEGMAAAVG